MRKPFLLLTVGGLVLAGCSLDPKSYETTPVTVQSKLGPVLCQLYTREIVEWDRSIDRPAKMSVEQADAICHDEGVRQKRGE